MSIRLNPYLGFAGNAREAMEFYQTVFGGKLAINTYSEFQASQDPADDNKVMHSQLEGDNGIVFMGSDAPSSMKPDTGSSISMSLSGDDEATQRGYWDKLSQGGQINVPLEKAEWGDAFGMLTDKFGVNWLVNITAKKAE